LKTKAYDENLYFERKNGFLPSEVEKPKCNVKDLCDGKQTITLVNTDFNNLYKTQNFKILNEEGGANNKDIYEDLRNCYYYKYMVYSGYLICEAIVRNISWRGSTEYHKRIVRIRYSLDSSSDGCPDDAMDNPDLIIGFHIKREEYRKCNYLEQLFTPSVCKSPILSKEETTNVLGKLNYKTLINIASNGYEGEIYDIRENDRDIEQFLVFKVIENGSLCEYKFKYTSAIIFDGSYSEMID